MNTDTTLWTLDSRSETQRSGGVFVAYSGVHQAYQIALAALEAGLLDEFLCSLLVAPGKWGKRLAALLGEQVLANCRCEGLAPGLVREHPWPLLRHRLKLRLFGSNAEPWTAVNPSFDRWAAGRLRNSRSHIFVGAETCARDCFRVARERGIVRVLDAPQVHSRFLVNLLHQGHAELGRKFSGRIDSNEIATRKEEELELADWILTYSEVHRRSFTENGIRAERLVEIPLWADAAFWDFPHNYDSESTKPLEVLFVGSIGIRKGIPWLLKSARELAGKVRLTLLGTTEPGFEDILAQHEHQFAHVPAQPRTALSLFYQRADILVLPSLVDSFGFVAMEAMLAGLPVIVSENCGVPVPSPSWRVPVMDSAAIAARLVMYAENRALLEEHGEVAKTFAREFTPAAYRQKIGVFLRKLL